MTSVPSTPPLAATSWRVYRIVPSVFPPTSIYDRVSSPADIEMLAIIEGMTNDRLREEAGDISLVPSGDRVSGPGTTAIMAAFTHLKAGGDRFTDGSYGVFYASLEIETAVAETRYHRERFLAETKEAAIDVDMRVYLVKLEGELHDLRTWPNEQIFDRDEYSGSQKLARSLREQGSNGLIYHSVRHAGGTCTAVFRPRLLSGCKQERHLTYRWNGTSITEVYEKRPFYKS
jgi:hypothetical protein